MLCLPPLLLLELLLLPLDLLVNLIELQLKLMLLINRIARRGKHCASDYRWLRRER